MPDGSDVFYAFLGLSLAIVIGYLVKYSSTVRNLLDLPVDNDRLPQTADSADEPQLKNLAGCCSSTESRSTVCKETQTSFADQPHDLDPPTSSSCQKTGGDIKSDSSTTELHCSEEPADRPCNKILLKNLNGVELPASGGRVGLLEEQVEKLKAEVERCKLAIKQTEAENGQLRDRLAEQAKSQLTKGPSKFENLTLGQNRPSSLIQRYHNLYSDGRIEAWDALDLLPHDIDDDNKEKLLFSIVVLCFRQSERSFDYRLRNLREVLLSSAGVRSLVSPVDDRDDSDAELQTLAQDIVGSVELYFRRTVARHNLTEDFQVVTNQLWSKLTGFSSLQSCESLLKYIDDCLKISWALTVQNPSYAIEYETETFSDDTHTRFHTSDPESDYIQSYLWPALVEKPSGFCVCKAVVVTGRQQ